MEVSKTASFLSVLKQFSKRFLGSKLRFYCEGLPAFAFCRRRRKDVLKRFAFRLRHLPRAGFSVCSSFIGCLHQHMLYGPAQQGGEALVTVVSPPHYNSG